MYLKDVLKIPEFANAGGTAKFCALINDAFDILNSRSLYDKNKYKAGISEKNVTDILHQINTIVCYIQNLKYVSDVSLVIHTRKKTSFDGMICSLQNVLNIYNKYFKCKNYYLLSCRKTPSRHFLALLEVREVITTTQLVTNL